MSLLGSIELWSNEFCLNPTSRSRRFLMLCWRVLGLLVVDRLVEQGIWYLLAIGRDVFWVATLARLRSDSTYQYIPPTSLAGLRGIPAAILCH